MSQFPFLESDSSYAKARVQGWCDAIGAYVSPSSEGETNRRTINTNFLDALAEILTIIVRRADRKDEWELSMCEHGLAARSPKLQCNISLHAWPGYEYQMKTNFAYAKHIGSMTDNFWQHILDISKFGEIVFEEDRIIEAPLFPARHVNKKMKSQLFKIARNFLVYSNEEYNDGVDCEDPFEGFGTLRVSWPITVQIEELMQKIYEVFIRCHQINYMLYRQEYILNHPKRR